MNRIALSYPVLLVLLGVGWSSCAVPPPEETTASNLVVLFGFEYDSNGKFKDLKLTVSNATTAKPTRGYICYDETNQNRCQPTGEEWKLTWRAADIQQGEWVEVEAKYPTEGNGHIFKPVKLDANALQLPVGTPIPPVVKDANGDFPPFSYKITVFDRNSRQIWFMDPDIMPHGPGGQAEAKKKP